MTGIASVLVLLDGDGSGRRGVRLAADTAGRQRATLRAVYLETWLETWRSSDAAEQSGAAPEWKPEWKPEWDIIAGDRARITRAVIDRALTADLIVAGRGTASKPRATWVMDLFAELPLLTGRPTLFVPERHRTESFGEHVMVAWNGSRESSRAVSDALPFLEAARDVTVLNVETARDRHPAEPGGEPRLASYLSRHGIPVRLCKSYVAGAGVGETIAARARESEADLLVMGARDHGRPGHVVLGPATRYLLDHLPVPVLMSH